MLLHDSSFSSSNRSINETHYSQRITVYSPLFHSTSTLVISIFGSCLNLICIVYLCFIISQDKTERQKPIHILSYKKYRFLVILTSNDFLLCLSSIISCLDEKYYSQSLIAHYHLCAFHILIWKFTLHFTPLLTIFILFRYHYILNKKFPLKHFNTTTFNQLLCTDLCIIIPFVLAIAWSVDGLWLWGETNLKRFVIPSINDNEQNQTNEFLSSSSKKRNLDQSRINFEEYNDENFYSRGQEIICYLLTNKNLNFTARLLHFIHADFLLLFLLHFIGLLLEIFLHIRLCCCLIARKITSSFLREQQLSLYILYIFSCLTLTSLPFYFYRSIEILFDLNILSYDYDIINSRTLAQIILCGISFKPVLYFILLCPKKILFKFKCYTSIKIETIDKIDDVLLVHQLNQQDKHRIRHPQRNRYSLTLTSLYPKIHINLRRLSNPILPTNIHRPSIIDENQDIPNVEHI